MDAPVTEKMCAERHNNLTAVVIDKNSNTAKMIDEIKDEVMKIRLLWQGNGVIGYGQKIDRLWEEHLRRTNTSQGLWDWIFRVGISIMLTYIAMKIGLK